MTSGLRSQDDVGTNRPRTCSGREHLANRSLSPSGEQFGHSPGRACVLLYGTSPGRQRQALPVGPPGRDPSFQPHVCTAGGDHRASRAMDTGPVTPAWGCGAGGARREGLGRPPSGLGPGSLWEGHGGVVREATEGFQWILHGCSLS